MSKASAEVQVQKATVAFFEVLVEEFAPCFSVHDTSSKGLKNPMAKPDIVLLAENEASCSCVLVTSFTLNKDSILQLLWSCIASFFELKLSIQIKDQYESAVGQTSN